MREGRRWAAHASMKAAHSATKPRETVLMISASADKQFKGAGDPQSAVDKGREEWAIPRQASDIDASHDILKAVEAYEVIAKEHADIVLPSITDERIHQVARMFPGRLGIGACRLRARHILWLSRGARAALGRLLEAIEKARRWPEQARGVVELALAKKSGGARLIGLATTLYRVWAKLRFLDCAAVLEQRIARPFLSAAPGRGAGQAALEAARIGEIATARGRTTATTLVDISQFYEHIAVH